MHCEHDTETSSMIHTRVSERAYEIWMEHGCPEGTADEDWRMAELEILGPQTADERPERLTHTAAV